MTPEREKYYRGISNEERAIRVLLLQLRNKLREKKFLATAYRRKIEKFVPFIGCLHSIKAIKFQIKALKRQLPAPLKHDLDYGICRCGMHYERLEIAGMFYCKRCGQAISSATWYRAERRWR